MGRPWAYHRIPVHCLCQHVHVLFSSLGAEKNKRSKKEEKREVHVLFSSLGAEKNKRSKKEEKREVHVMFSSQKGKKKNISTSNH